jgi:hypothetical protein
MKMISQHALGEGVCDGRNMLFVQLQEMFVIPLLNKYILTIRAAIVDMVVCVEKQRRRAGHGKDYISSVKDPKGFLDCSANLICRVSLLGVVMINDRNL